MDEQRLQEYFNLIQALLSCPSGEEEEILQRHPDLVDEGLVEAMVQVAAMMAEEGDANAGWLRGFALQLAEAIGKLSWQQLNQIGVQLYQQGQYSRAVIVAEQAFALAWQLWRDDHPYIATSLNNLAALYSSQGKLQKAEPLYEEALAMTKRLFPTDHLNVATSLSNLAVLYQSQGRFDAAEPLYEEALAMRKRLFPTDHPDIAISLSELAGLYCKRGCFDAAEPLYEEALAMRKRLFPTDHPDVAISLSGLAGLYCEQGCFDAAEALYEEALAMRKRLFSTDHPDIAQSFNNLAVLYRSQGRLTKAESLLEEALAMKKRLFPSDHPSVALSLNNLAELYHLQGRFDAAELLYEEALAMKKLLFPSDHPDVALSLNNLAGLYQSQGRFDATGLLYEKALAMRKRLFPNNHPDVAQSLNNLAALYESQGRFDAAEPLYEEALAMTKRLFPTDHPHVATVLDSLAGLYHSQERFDAAEPLYEEALAMRKRLFSTDHPDVALSFNNLAGLYQSQGRFDAAILLHEEALAMTKRLFPNDHPDIALSFNNLAGLYHSHGCFDAAALLHKEALAMRKRLFPNNHPDVAQSLNNLAGLLAATHCYPEALDLMKEATEIENCLISRVFAASSDSDRIAYLQAIRGQFNLFLSLVYRHLRNSPQAVHTALDLVLQRKALTAAALAAQNQAIYSGRYPHLKLELEKLRELSDQIIYFTYTQPQLELIPQLQAEHDRLQKKLASQVPEIQLQEQPSDCRAVAWEVPEGSTLVEFVCFKVFDFHAVLVRGESPWQPSRYLAFVLPAKQPDQVQMIDLGEAEHIDRLIQVFRQSLSLDGNNLGNRLDMGGDDDTSEFLQYNPAAGIELRQVLFGPIRPYLSESKHLLLSPDGGLNLVPFQILPIDETGQQLLMDEYTISYLSAGRDILRSKIQTTRPAFKPLVIADPDFNLIGEESAEATTTNQTQLLNTLGGVHFEPAPGTRFLGEGVAKILQVSPYLGKESLESHLTTGECPNILLIATHGVFLPDSPHSPPQPPLLRGEEDWFRFNRLSGGKVENPMLRSGLAFAGANTWLKGGTLPPNAGKGLIFAQDVAALDLWATELAVLSACNTAIGDIKIGEGVFGLRRAFAVAGAKTLVMSLWSVPDRATALLMQHFFTNLHEGLGRAEALQEAQNYIRTITVKDLQQSDLGQKVLEELVEKKLLPQDLQFCQSDKPLAHPFFWGAWVCQGDTTPISSEILH